MNKTIVHHEGAISLEVAGRRVQAQRAVIKIGLDVHARLYVAVAQYDHLLPDVRIGTEPAEESEIDGRAVRPTEPAAKESISAAENNSSAQPKRKRSQDHSKTLTTKPM